MAEARNSRRTAIRAAAALAVVLALSVALAYSDETRRELWVKALHVIAVISWMAGMLYMPRLFIYHLETKPGSEASETFKVMEARLFRIIMQPAMVIAWVLGLYLAWSVYGFQGGWLHVKLACVVALSGVHEFYGRALRELALDQRKRSTRFWRFMNEAPTLLMIVIVIMVIVKPF